MELLVAIGILATCLVMVVGVFLTVTRASQKSLDLTAGTIVAQSILSRELYGIMGSDAARSNFFSGSYATDPFVEGTERLNQAVFTYRIYATPVMIGDMGNRVMQLNAVVWWWNDEGSAPSEGRAGYGYLRSELTRLVNENSRY